MRIFSAFLIVAIFQSAISFGEPNKDEAKEAETKGTCLKNYPPYEEMIADKPAVSTDLAVCNGLNKKSSCINSEGDKKLKRQLEDSEKKLRELYGGSRVADQKELLTVLHNTIKERLAEKSYRNSKEKELDESLLSLAAFGIEQYKSIDETYKGNSFKNCVRSVYFLFQDVQCSLFASDLKEFSKDSGMDFDEKSCKQTFSSCEEPMQAINKKIFEVHDKAAKLAEQFQKAKKPAAFNEKEAKELPKMKPSFVESGMNQFRSFLSSKTSEDGDSDEFEKALTKTKFCSRYIAGTSIENFVEQIHYDQAQLVRIIEAADQTNNNAQISFLAKATAEVPVVEHERRQEVAMLQVLGVISKEAPPKTEVPVAKVASAKAASSFVEIHHHKTDKDKNDKDKAKDALTLTQTDCEITAGIKCWFPVVDVEFEKDIAAGDYKMWPGNHCAAVGEPDYPTGWCYIDKPLGNTDVPPRRWGFCNPDKCKDEMVKIEATNGQKTTSVQALRQIDTSMEASETTNKAFEAQTFADNNVPAPQGIAMTFKEKDGKDVTDLSAHKLYDSKFAKDMESVPKGGGAYSPTMVLSIILIAVVFLF
eukprot:Platyproteum_vivax@DN3829_c0_g1_i1.p1